MQLFIKPDFVVIELDFFALLDCLVHDVDIVEKRLVVRLVPLFDGIDVLDVAFLVLTAERYELVNKLGGVRRVYVARGQNAVDEKTKLCVFKFARGEIRAV